MMKRGPNDLDEIINRLKKENKRLKKCLKEQMDTENRTHKVICHDCHGNGFRKDCYGEVYQCKNCKSQGEIAFTEEEMLENIDDVGLTV